MTTALKTIDEKGRVAVGRKYAGRSVCVREDADALVLMFYRAVPEHEAWLWENETASQLVQTGLQQARNGELSTGPDLTAAFALADEIPDE